MKRVGITFTQIPFIRGGAEIFADTLKENLQMRGYKTEIISMPYKWYPIEEYYNNMMMWRNVDLTESNGEKIDYLIGTKFPSYFAKHPNKLLWLVHQERVVYDLLDTEYSPFKGKELETRKFREIDTKVLNESKKIFTISQTVTNRLKQFNQIDSEVLYHPPKFADEYYVDNFDDYIFSIGRLDPKKRIDLLVEAMRYTNPKVKCLIGGTGTEYEKLKQLINKYNLNDRVKLLGFVDDNEMLKLYANSLGVYFCPIDEDLGYITLEAFSSKKPVITANDSGGTLEFVRHEESGFILQPKPEEIAKSINALYENKKMAREFGENGYNFIKDITWDNAMDRIIAEFNKMDRG